MATPDELLLAGWRPCDDEGDGFVSFPCSACGRRIRFQVGVLIAQCECGVAHWVSDDPIPEDEGEI